VISVNESSLAASSTTKREEQAWTVGEPGHSVDSLCETNAAAPKFIKSESEPNFHAD